MNPHAFRPASATHLANILTEAQMKEFIGWIQDSDMASVYVHLSGRDVDRAILKLYGMMMDDERSNGKLLKPKNAFAAVRRIQRRIRCASAVSFL